MKISYAITLCNEFTEIQNLIPHILKYKRREDEIVILYDESNGDEGVEEFLRAKSVNNAFSWHKGEFDGHFGNWKNKLTDLCNGDYIFQIDADEIPSKILIQNLHDILKMNEVDVVLVPRVNTVEGLTQEHIDKWGWNVNPHGWVNWPDYQVRIYKRNERIRWEGKVHERITGITKFSQIPPVEELAYHHPKPIERQERQNAYYETI